MPKLTNLSTSLALLEQKLDTHIHDSNTAHATVTIQLDAMSRDVKSLLLSRSFLRGVGRMAMIVSASVATLISVLIGIIKWH